jgi:hypothetical protein
MKKQTGSAIVVVVVAILAMILAVGTLAVVSYVSAANQGNEMEMGLKATFDNNKNLMAQYSQKVMEAAQVPAMARDDLLKLTKAAIEGRYGEKGSQAVFQMITEQNPTVDGALYRKIQQIVESGRNEFQNGQTRLIDQKRAYETQLGYVWKGFWMHLAGYPKVNLAEYKIVTTDRTESSFKAGREEAPLQLRQVN